LTPNLSYDKLDASLAVPARRQEARGEYQGMAMQGAYPVLLTRDFKSQKGGNRFDCKNFVIVAPGIDLICRAAVFPVHPFNRPWP